MIISYVGERAGYNEHTGKTIRLLEVSYDDKEEELVNHIAFWLDRVHGIKMDVSVENWGAIKVENKEEFNELAIMIRKFAKNAKAMKKYFGHF